VFNLNVKVIALCRDYDKAKRRFEDFWDDPRFTIMCEDVANKLTINGDVHYIIHAASPASSQYYGIDPISVISPNVFGTKHLLELAREKNARGFLLFSSGDVCGNIDKKVIVESDSGYLDPADIRNCYSESKRMAENMCACWHYQYNVPTFIVRPEHTYGPTMDLENDRRVFAEFVSDIVNNRDVTVKSDGLAVRTFCYLGDATDGFFRVLLNGKPGETYNVGNKEGQMSKVVYHARTTSKTYLENSNKQRPMLSTVKLEALGYKCKTGVRDGFKRTIESFL
jgi:UDP-glucuronate decarboxylase